jgi:hypothetical protein
LPTAAVEWGVAREDTKKVYQCMMTKIGEQITNHMPANTVADSAAQLALQSFGTGVDESSSSRTHGLSGAGALRSVASTRPWLGNDMSVRFCS